MLNLQTRPRLLATVLLALALVVGGLAGATLDRAVFRPAADEQTQLPPAEPWLEERGWGMLGERVPGERMPGEGVLGERVPGAGARGEGMRGEMMRGEGPHRGEPRSGEGLRRGEPRGDGVPGPNLPLRPRHRTRYIDQLTRDLELSAEQRSRIEALLQEQQERMRGLHQDLRQQRDAILTETRAGIFEILTPEQQRSLRPRGRAR
jgi:hypothetical protein